MEGRKLSKLEENGLRSKYIVIKKDDQQYLSPIRREHLNDILTTINHMRELNGKPFNEYVVVNLDEPYAQEVLDVLRKHGVIGGEPKEEKLCYIEDVNGGYFCYEKDMNYFLYEKFKDCVGTVCSIGTMAELKKEFSLIQPIYTRDTTKFKRKFVSKSEEPKSSWRVKYFCDGESWESDKDMSVLNKGDKIVVGQVAYMVLERLFNCNTKEVEIYLTAFCALPHSKPAKESDND